MRKVLASAVAFVHLAQVAVASPAGNIWSERQAAPAASVRLPDLGAVDIPPLLRVASPDSAARRWEGLLATLPLNRLTLREARLNAADDQPPILLIQDVHLNPEAQANIASALESLYSKGAVAFLGVEGAFDKFDFDRVRAAPEDKRRRVMDAFLSHNLLSAPSVAGALSAAEPPPTFGFDALPAYDANVRSWREASPRAPALRESLTEARNEHAADAADRSPAVAAFDRLRSAHRSGRIALADYLDGLRKLAADAGGSPAPSAAITAYVEAARLETALDFPRIESERRRVLERLVAALSPGDRETLVRQTLAFKSGAMGFAAFYGALRNLCESRGIRLSETPAFDAYLRYVVRAGAIDVAALFTAVAAWETALGRSLAARSGDADFLRRGEKIDYAFKLLDFGLTAEEWAAYRSNPERLAGLGAFESFYGYADARSRHIAAAMAAAIEKAGARPGFRALVCGGFHTDELTALFRAQGRSYVVASPKITRVEDGQGTKYLSVFAEEKTPLERLLAGERLFVCPAYVHLPYPTTRAAVDRALADPGLVSRVERADAALAGANMPWLKRLVQSRFGVSDRRYSFFVAPLLENGLVTGLAGALAGLPLHYFTGSTSAAFLATSALAWLMFWGLHPPPHGGNQKRDEAFAQRVAEVAAGNAFLASVLLLFVGVTPMQVAALSFGVGAVIHFIVNVAAARIKNQTDLDQFLLYSPPRLLLAIAEIVVPFRVMAKFGLARLGLQYYARGASVAVSGRRAVLRLAVEKSDRSARANIGLRGKTMTVSALKDRLGAEARAQLLRAEPGPRRALEWFNAGGFTGQVIALDRDVKLYGVTDARRLVLPPAALKDEAAILAEIYAAAISAGAVRPIDFVQRDVALRSDAGPIFIDEILARGLNVRTPDNTARILLEATGADAERRAVARLAAAMADDAEDFRAGVSGVAEAHPSTASQLGRLLPRLRALHDASPGLFDEYLSAAALNPTILDSVPLLERIGAIAKASDAAGERSAPRRAEFLFSIEPTLNASEGEPRAEWRFGRLLLRLVRAADNPAAMLAAAERQEAALRALPVATQQFLPEAVEARAGLPFTDADLARLAQLSPARAAMFRRLYASARDLNARIDALSLLRDDARWSRFSTMPDAEVSFFTEAPRVDALLFRMNSGLTWSEIKTLFISADPAALAEIADADGFDGRVAALREAFGEETTVRLMRFASTSADDLVSLVENPNFIPNVRANLAAFYGTEGRSDVFVGASRNEVLLLTADPSTFRSLLDDTRPLYGGTLPVEKPHLVFQTISAVARLKANDAWPRVAEILALLAENDVDLPFRLRAVTFFDRAAPGFRAVLVAAPAAAYVPWAERPNVLDGLANVHFTMSKTFERDRAVNGLIAAIYESGERSLVKDLEVFARAASASNFFLDRADAIAFLNAALESVRAADSPRKKRKALEARIDVLRTIGGIFDVYKTSSVSGFEDIRDGVAIGAAELVKGWDAERPKAAAAFYKNSVLSLIRRITGVDEINAEVLKEPATLEMLNRILTVYLSLDGHNEINPPDRDLMKARVKALLADFVRNADEAALQKTILAYPENQAEIAKLVKAGYAPELFTTGLDFTMPAPSNAPADPAELETEIGKAISVLSGELVEIAASLGRLPAGMTPDTRITTVGDAQTLVDTVANSFTIAERRDPAVREKLRRAAQVLDNLRATERKFRDTRAASADREKIRVIIGKRFLAEASAGVNGWSGCFETNGLHREMPPKHALEANSMMVGIYDAAGKRMIANAVLAFTDKGVVAYADHPSTMEIDTDAVWLEAWRRLSAMAPAVVLNKGEGFKNSAGRRTAEALGLAAVDRFRAVKRPTVWNSIYVDFGQEREDGVHFDLENPIVIRHVPRDTPEPEAPKPAPVENARKLAPEELSAARGLLFGLGLKRLNFSGLAGSLEAILLADDAETARDVVDAIRPNAAGEAALTPGERGAILDVLYQLRIIFADGTLRRVFVSMKKYVSGFEKRAASRKFATQADVMEDLLSYLEKEAGADAMAIPMPAASQAKPSKAGPIALPPAVADRLDRALRGVPARTARPAARFERAISERLVGEYHPAGGQTVFRGELAIGLNGIDLRLADEGRELGALDANRIPAGTSRVQFDLFVREGHLMMEVLDIVSDNARGGQTAMNAVEGLIARIVAQTGRPVTMTAETAIFTVPQRRDADGNLRWVDRRRDASGRFGWTRVKTAQSLVKYLWITDLEPKLASLDIDHESLRTRGVKQDSFFFYERAVAPPAAFVLDVPLRASGFDRRHPTAYAALKYAGAPILETAFMGPIILAVSLLGHGSLSFAAALVAAAVMARVFGAAHGRESSVNKRTLSGWFLVFALPIVITPLLAPMVAAAGLLPFPALVGLGVAASSGLHAAYQLGFLRPLSRIAGRLARLVAPRSERALKSALVDALATEPLSLDVVTLGRGAKVRPDDGERLRALQAAGFRVVSDPAFDAQGRRLGIVHPSAAPSIVLRHVRSQRNYVAGPVPLGTLASPEDFLRSLSNRSDVDADAAELLALVRRGDVELVSAPGGVSTDGTVVSGDSLRSVMDAAERSSYTVGRINVLAGTDLTFVGLESVGLAGLVDLILPINLHLLDEKGKEILVNLLVARQA